MEDGGRAGGAHDGGDGGGGRDVAGVVGDAIHAVVRSVNVYDVDFAVGVG